MDVLEVRSAAQEALSYVRESGSPYFLEIVTYRYRGHSMGDPERYRESEEIEKWRADDPIGIFHKHLIDGGQFSEETLDAEEALVEQELEGAIQFAESSPNPSPEELFANIYVDSLDG